MSREFTRPRLPVSTELFPVSTELFPFPIRTFELVRANLRIPSFNQGFKSYSKVSSASWWYKLNLPSQNPSIPEVTSGVNTLCKTVSGSVESHLHTPTINVKTCALRGHCWTKLDSCLHILQAICTVLVENEKVKFWKTGILNINNSLLETFYLEIA